MVLVRGGARADNILVGEGADGCRWLRKSGVVAFGEATGDGSFIDIKTTKGEGVVSWRG